jgi:hypothetical protein
MSVSATSVFSSSSKVPLKTEAVESSIAPTVKKAAAPSADQGVKVTISGRAMMLSRLFRTTDPSLEPSVETNKNKPSGLVYDFLTHEDRETLSKVYEYAVANGTDPLKVDNLAFDLACFRHGEGVLMRSSCLYDLQGNPVVPEFNPADEAIAQRLLGSRAISDTKIDHGFLSQILDPGYFSTHASDFEFLQQVVFAFSASGSDGSANPNAKPVVRPKAEDFAPIKIQTPDDGKTLMQSRLFGIDGSGERVSPVVNSSLVSYLTGMDKAVLTQKYDQALQRGEDMTAVDKLALSLGALRMRESMLQMMLRSRER